MARPPAPVRLALCAITAALVLAGCGAKATSSSSSSPGSATSSSTSSTASPTSTAAAQGQLGFEGVPIESGSDLAPASTTQTGPVHGIDCGSTEQLAYHIHAHLIVYVAGQPRALPGGIGIPGSVVEQSSQGPVAAGGQCIYWLHTHAPDGIIHIESPTPRIYKLGEFFDEWHQPLSSAQVAGATGKVTALVNGRPWPGDPRAIPLTAHAVIELAVGKPVPAFSPVAWAQTSL